MFYPEFLKNKDTIGITALSSGCNDQIKEFKVSINNLKKYYNVSITSDVYSDSIYGASTTLKVKEFNELLDEEIKMIMISRGGEFLYDTLDGIDYLKLKNKKIWIEGYSDPTSLLYILTTKYDMATIYGMNAKSYDNTSSLYQKNNLEILKGNLIIQKSYPLSKNYSLNGEFKSKGILIGGCIDVLRNIIGTKYDNTIDFINKYRNYGIIWYFDIFNMTGIDLYLTLKQFNDASWFIESDTFLFGEVLIKDESVITYRDAIKRALKNKKNIIIDANIGHIRPSFTFINGSIGEISYINNELIIKQDLIRE